MLISEKVFFYLLRTKNKELVNILWYFLFTSQPLQEFIIYIFLFQILSQYEHMFSKLLHNLLQLIRQNTVLKYITSSCINNLSKCIFSHTFPEIEFPISPKNTQNNTKHNALIYFRFKKAKLRYWLTNKANLKTHKNSEQKSNKQYGTKMYTKKRLLSTIWGVQSTIATLSIHSWLHYSSFKRKIWHIHGTKLLQTE